MKMELSKKELGLLLTSLFVVIAFSIGGYYLYLSPKAQELANKETQLETQERLLATLQAQTPNTRAPLAETVAELQKKVPVKKQLEQLILDLNKAEVVGNSFITNMSFSEADVSSSGSQTTEEEAAEEVAPLSPPEGIRKLRVNLSVTSPSYSDLMRFLDALETLNRRVVIESVAFSGGSELTSIEQEREAFSYSVSLAAFYLPQLATLTEQLPELEVPAPSNKQNPFPASSNLSR